jgi:hypothetical protein
LGLLIVVVITAANVSEQAGAKNVLKKLNRVRDRFNRLIKIWALLNRSMNQPIASRKAGAVRPQRHGTELEIIYY